MKIADLLREDLVVPNLRSSSAGGVIRELADVLAERNPGVRAEDVARILTEREEKGATTIGDGVAVPHGKLPALDRVIACLGRARRGIDFGAPNGVPTRYFFVLMAPEDAAGLHLKALARISRLFQEPGLLSRLKAARTAGDMVRAIADEDSRC